jgi:heme-degrading monooxygenase HmoA
VISRIWHGWTRPEDADAYETFLREEMLPSIDEVPGYRGATLLRRDLDGEIEFVTITRFESLDAVREFAGENVEQAVVRPEAQRLLKRYDSRSLHYETVVDT